jgi:hypothetical protein
MGPSFSQGEADFTTQTRFRQPAVLKIFGNRSGIPQTFVISTAGRNLLLLWRRFPLKEARL